LVDEQPTLVADNWASDAVDRLAFCIGSKSVDMEYTETIQARGHEHVQATHASTFEVTTDDWLTPAGDCILAIEADRTPADFSEAFVEAARSHDAEITATLSTDDHTHTITGRGHPELTYEGDRSAVGRTSDYVDDRTIMVGATTAAESVDRELVAALADGVELTFELRVTADQ